MLRLGGPQRSVHSIEVPRQPSINDDDESHQIVMDLSISYFGTP